MMKFVISVLLMLLVLSCDRQKVFEQFRSIEDHKWSSTNIVNFNANISDTISSHNVLIAIRNTGQYEFSNLYLFVTAISPDGSQVRDTTEITLADEHGRWLGKGSAAVYTLYHPFRSNIKFPVKGIYQFNIEQAMWKKELKFISDIGLRIEKTGQR